MELTGSLTAFSASEPVNSVYLKAVSVKIPGGKEVLVWMASCRVAFFWLMEVKMVRP